MYARAGAGPPAMRTFFQKAMPTGLFASSGTPTRPTAPPGWAISKAVTTAWSEANALEHGIDAETARELAHPLHSCLTALADDVGCAELVRQRDPVGMTTEEDDLRGSEALGGDHPAQPDCAVAHDSHALSRRDLCRQSGMVPGAHHVCQREQRRHQGVVCTDRQNDECSVGPRNTHRLALSSVDIAKAVSASVKAGAVQSASAEHTGAGRPKERRNDEVARLDRADIVADGLDDADELMPHAPPRLARFH
jgi:hypothetical protein